MLDISSSECALHLCSVLPRCSVPRILLVDDNPDILASLAALLRLTGYKVATFSDPSAAIELAQTTPFDLLITDFDMPEMNGFELATIVAAEHRRLRVIVISGMLLQNLPAAEIAQHGWFFVPKPINVGRLLSIIEHDLPSKKMRRATCPAMTRLRKRLGLEHPAH